MTSAAIALWWRELVRFVRQPSRVFSAAASPLVFWLLIGSGLSASFRLPGGESEVSYLEYFFPGTVALLVLFAAIFSTISVIEDRHEGFLQSVLVAPVSRIALVLGKVLGGATLAWFQGSLFLILAPLAGIPLSVGSILAASGVLALLSLALTAVGFGFAWKVDSTQGFHGVMNLLLVPMWLLSGAFFPLAGAPAWLQWIMRLNPMTFGVAALRRALYGAGREVGGGLPGMGPALAVLTAFGIVALALDLLVVAREGD